MATQRAAGEANDAAVLRAVAAGGDAGVTPGELLAAVGMAERTMRASVTRLVAAQLVVRDGRKRVIATPAGVVEAGAGLPGVALSTALSAAVDLLPAEAMRAFFRLLLSGVVARHHLRSVYHDGWGSFVAVGPTKTGKTSMATMVCRVFGLEKPLVIRTAPTETLLSLWGRREKQPGHGYLVEPAAALSLPFLCIDEFDKASAELRGRLLTLAQGDAVVAGEGDQQLEVAPTVLFCANASPASLPEAYRRRSVILDLEPLTSQLAGIDRVMRQLLVPARSALPALDLARLKPTATALPDDITERMLVALKGGLTDQGSRWVDERAVQYLALGRSALGGAGLVQAAMATAADYLTCARTVNEALPGTPAVILEALGAGHLVPSPANAEVELAARRGRQHAAAVEDLELVMTRAAWTKHLQQAAQEIRQVPAPHRAQAHGLREALTTQARSIAAQRSPQGLADAVDVAKPFLTRANNLKAAIAQEQRDAGLRAQQEASDRRLNIEQKRRDQAAKKQAVATDRRRQRQEKQHLTRLQRDLQALYNRTRPGPAENPVSLLERKGYVRRVEETSSSEVAPLLAGLRAKWTGQAPAPRLDQVTRVTFVDLAGAGHIATDLEVGTSGFRQVIAAAAAQKGIRLEQAPTAARALSRPASVPRTAQSARAIK